jgi:hypothetical protein
MTFPAIPVTEERGAATERVPTAGCCGGGRGRRWLAAQTERGEAAASGGCDGGRGRRRLAAAMRRSWRPIEERRSLLGRRPERVCDLMRFIFYFSDYDLVS